MKLGSLEYLEEMMRVSNADEKYLKLAKGEYESYTMVLNAEPEKGVEDIIIVGYKVEGGRITEVWEGERPTTFTISGPYGVWVDILRGKLGPNKALLMRKLKVRGNFLKLLKLADATIRWVELLRTIPTEFEGEYAKYNL
jgi:putative sterol carrier protein